MVKNIALCFHGLPRLVNECYEDIYNYFIKKMSIDSDYKVDIYGFFWWDDSYKGKINRLHMMEKYDENENPIDTFKKLYNPKKVEYDKCPDDFDGSKFPLEGYNTKSIFDDNLYSKLMASCLLYGLYCRFNSIIKVIEQLDNNIKYDIVIICRSDLLTFSKDIGFKDEIKNLNFNEYIYFPSTMEGGTKYAGEHPNKIGDWLFFGNYKNISNFCNKIFDMIKNYKNYYKNEICPLHNTERLTYWALQSNIKLAKYDSTISIRRFKKEEWEDKNYYEKNHINHMFYVDIFNKETYFFNKHELLPFYIENIKIIR